MHHEITLDAEASRMTIRLSGRPTAEAVRAFVRFVLSHPDRGTGLRLLLDIGGLTEQLPLEDIHELAAWCAASVPWLEVRRVAVVAEAPAAFGSVRMFESLTGAVAAGKIGVFPVEEEALAWLESGAGSGGGPD
jgi:hypothetical protein